MKYDKLAQFLKREGKNHTTYVRFDEIEHSNIWKERSLYFVNERWAFHVPCDDRLIDWKTPEKNIDYRRVASEQQEYASARLSSDAGKMVTQDRVDVKKIWDEMLALPKIIELQVTPLIYDDAGWPHCCDLRQFEYQALTEDGTGKRFVWINKGICDAMHTDRSKLSGFKFILHEKNLVEIQEGSDYQRKWRTVAITTAATIDF